MVPPPGGTQNPSPKPGQPPGPGRILSVAEFSGPLPPPSILQGYETVLPGAADRIIAMAEKQSAHRQELEHVATNASIDEMRLQFDESRRGQLCAVIVALALIGGGVYLAKIGHPWQGTAMGGGGVIGSVGLQAIVSTFLRGRAQEEEKRENKPKNKLKKA